MIPLIKKDIDYILEHIVISKGVKNKKYYVKDFENSLIEL